MFGLGAMEVAVIVLLAVMLFPPRELPKIARGIARLYGQIKRTADDFKSAILDDEDLNAPIREIKDAYNETRYQIQRAERETRAEITKARMEARMAARLRKEEARRKSAAERRRGEGGAAPAGTEGGAQPEVGGAPAGAVPKPVVARSVTGPVPRGATPPASSGLPAAEGTEHVLDDTLGSLAAVRGAPVVEPATRPVAQAAEAAPAVEQSADPTQGVA